jgi:transglutaminase-like putative cysteine protease
VPDADRVAITPSRPRAAKAAPQWPMSLALFFGLASAMGGLGAAFTEASWWFVAVGVGALVTLSLAIVRAYSRFRILVPLTGIVVGLVCLTFSFAPSFAFVGFIPTFDVFRVFGELALDGVESIADQSIPAEPVTSIVFLVTVGSAVLAMLLDFIAFVAKRPAIVGVVLLAVIMVPAFFASGKYDPFFFFLTAIAYLLVLYIGLGEARMGGAIGVAASGLAVALILPLVLPPVAPADELENRPGFAVGVSAFITLGENLRRSGDSTVLTYTTDATRGVYLTVSVIDNFNGNKWGPSLPVTRTDAAITAIGPVPGFTAEGVGTVESTTTVTVVNMGGHWLPVPYAPRAITGADDNWTYNLESLEIDSPTESARGEVYEVTSALPDPTVSQLRASGDTVTVDPRFLAIPTGLPAIVTDTAAGIAAPFDNRFDQALALQNYFLSGEFEYSETAPVDEGYDGTSAQVVGEFLVQKSGYCVHFSSAMAVMARTLGIPARIAVGFTPGSPVRGSDGISDYFEVTTANLHAWPELWFEGIGWMRFEPTVGLGETPTFNQDGAQVNPDPLPSTGATAAPTRAPTVTATATPTSRATSSAGSDEGYGTINSTIPRITIAILIGVVIVVLLLPLLPIIVRTARRVRRYWRVRRRGSATEAWIELNDTAVDLGWDAATTTPRQFAELVKRGMSTATVAALGRLLAAVEVTAFSRDNGRSALADVRVVRRAMWKVATRNERVRALLTPASVVLRRRSASPE